LSKVEKVVRRGEEGDRGNSFVVVCEWWEGRRGVEIY